MQKSYLVAGLGYGDEGKGTIIDYLTRQYGAKAVLRYNGGPQAAHHVVSGERVHCFSQLGSGSFVPGVKTCLTKHMLVDPSALTLEVQSLEYQRVHDPYSRLFVDPGCVVVTPFHKLLGQIKEMAARNGSCGMGVGAAVKYSSIWGEKVLRIGDLLDEQTARSKLDFMQRVCLDQAEQIAEQNKHNQGIQRKVVQLGEHDLVDILLGEYLSIASHLNIEKDCHNLAEGPRIYEGAQGVLLDVDNGFWPHVTKTKTTFANALESCGDDVHNEVHKIGVIRAYMTRHGAGPFVTEDIGLGKKIPDMHNKAHEWQGEFRIGWLDIVALKYSLEVIGGVDSIALTNIDRLLCLGEIRICPAYEYCGADSIEDFFDYSHEDGKIYVKSIKVAENPSHEHQEKLGRLLNKCKPVYSSFSMDQYSGRSAFDAYSEHLEDSLGVKIEIVSAGPEARDKLLIRP